MSASKLMKVGKQVFAIRMIGTKPVIPGATFSVPDNMQEISDSQKSQSLVDRSREASGQQTSHVFTGGFMSSQAQMEELSSDSGIDQSVMGNNTCYDMDGHANLQSVLQTNVPEPYRAENVANLKEGVPEGLSDCVKSQGQRWSMDDRIDHSYEIQS